MFCPTYCWPKRVVISCLDAAHLVNINRPIEPAAYAVPGFHWFPPPETREALGDGAVTVNPQT
jgi:hypothetical protein